MKSPKQPMGQLRSKRTKASATMPEEETLNTISCEICRQRKCKCDRRLPFCSQCASEPSKCIYPESGKRGLPLGYLNQLEQRLQETESALYGALTTLRALGQTTSPLPKPDQPPKHKSARMAEWSGLPLRNWKDMEHWASAMSDQFATEESGSLGYAIPMPVTPCETRPPEEPHRAWRGDGSGSPYESQPVQVQAMASPYFAVDEVIASPVMRVGEAADVGVSVDAVKRSTRAEELSHRNPSLYF